MAWVTKMYHELQWCLCDGTPRLVIWPTFGEHKIIFLYEFHKHTSTAGALAVATLY